MNIAINLFKAPHVGVRELKEKLSSFLKKDSPLIVTDHGEPTKVIVPYTEMVELLDILDEMSDPETLAAVAAGRKSIRQGAKGIAVLDSLRARKKHK